MRRPELWGPLRARYETPAPRRMLALDGGGIRGVLTLQILKSIETQLGTRLCDYFDYIAGTSTGAIIAAGLSIGKSVEELIDFYRETGTEMFQQTRYLARLNSLYQNGPLQQKLQEVFEQRDLKPARPGAGGVHHVAFRSNDADYDAWAEKLNTLGIPNSGKVDRYWFRSLYFREPNGILFEIATDGPGFGVDEDQATLGEKVVLAPFLEPQREKIVKNLKPIGVPHSIFLENIFARTYDASKLNEDTERVRAEYQNRGYFKVLVQDPKTQIHDTGGGVSIPLIHSKGKAVDITMPIEEGDRYTLGSISFKNNKAISNQTALRGLFPIKDGDIFATVVQQPFGFTYDAVKRMVLDLRGDKSQIPADKKAIFPTEIIQRENVDKFWTELKTLRGR